MPELRQNIITGDWVVIAPERAKRPKDFIIPRGVKVSDEESCPFCVDSEGFKSNKKYLKSESENIYVIENRYPAFVEDESKKSVRSFYPEDGFYRARASVGDHEVVVVKDHNVDLLTFSQSLLDELFETIRERYIWIKEHEKVVSIMPIYNHGPEAGASIRHPHAQIFGSGIVANTIGREIDGAEKYFGINGACVYCDLVKHELKEKTRVIAEEDGFVAIEFYASRFPFETWILPKDHQSQFELTSKKSMVAFSKVVHQTMEMLRRTIDNISLNFYIHTLPVIHENSASYHWHMEIVPRVSTWGGFELGSEIIINVMSPEEAAHYLKEKKT
ncbi:hypothetical protein COT78_02285 [Candidatus Berkelbacteria bacterium CG10_big_fil_rev_8_21_14_0_10_43_13]|uniref:Uncharacterized protein n=1 Tax=Candidatus Berkelbacteria bacterium CG10_big_fil_rev_8_21_14_0_10_43_13 TaxID=1974514 RepID=A0A2H0W6F7_9BACT|nr:MAG: hypothetical protein COT78_02285 [Candidatus Berkelbacteria bacterium CG10_big_fil_rev_8_21_14_0_10_43_13]